MNDMPAFSVLPEPSVSNAQEGGRVPWVDPERELAFNAWLANVAPAYQLLPASLRPASADAGFRRYLRIDTSEGGNRIIMDAPPALENSVPFVQVAALIHQAGLNGPQILNWDEAGGFMLLNDLGSRTMLETILQIAEPSRPEQARPLYLQALDALISWQQSSKAGILPAYDAPLLRRELQLFPDWYLGKHRGVTVEGTQREALDRSFELIIARNLAAPMVYVHRDFMPRNLMPSADGGPIGVLDFQDAVHGPITYDIASLMRDAFVSWDEEFVLDITVRYWERAKKAGLMNFEDWASDFGSFWRAVEWMGLQRHLKVAGIFARLSLRDNKPKYLADTPRFITYIRHTAGRYRELAPLLRLVDEIEGTTAADGWTFGRV